MPNLEDDVHSDISEITGIASWMQDIHDANDGDGEDFDDQITIVEHDRRVGTGRAISARDIATRAAATRRAGRDVNRRMHAKNPNAKSAPTNRRASADRLTSNQQRLMHLRATQQEQQGQQQQQRRSQSIPNTQTVGAGAGRYASPTCASDSWMPLNNTHHTSQRVTTKQILSTNPIPPPSSAPIISKSKRSSTGTDTTRSESIEALVEAADMVDRQTSHDLNLYIGRGMSSNVSVASSITESQATTYVPGIGRLETPAAVVVPSNERHPVRRISSLREDDDDDYNINNDDDLAKEYHVDAELALAKSKLASWLASLHLEQYFQLLINEGYDSMDRVRYIDRNELERMDILPGHRRALFHAINALRKRRSSTATGGSASHHNHHMPQISEEGSHASTIVSSRAGSANRSATSSSKGASSGRRSDPRQVDTKTQPHTESRRTSLPETSTNSAAHHVHKDHRTRSIATSKDSILVEKERIQHRLPTLKSKRDGTSTHKSLQPPAIITKQVNFATAEVRTYQRYWSDNPSVSAGPPVGIGWKVLATHRFSTVAHSIARDERNLKTGFCPVLTREERESCLEEAGFSSKDIASATREATRTKARRRTTVQNLNAGKTAEVEEAVESVRRAIVKAFVPKSKSKKQLYNTAA